MKKSKSLIALIVTVCLTVSLAACGGNNDSQKQSSTTKTVDTSAQVSTNTSANIEVKDPIELSLWTFEGSEGAYKEGTAKEDIVKDAIFNKTGVKVTKIVTNGSLKAMEKFNLLYASNQIPDVMFGWMGPGDTNPIDPVKKLMEKEMVWTWSDSELKALAPEAFQMISPATYSFVRDTMQSGDKNVALITQNWYPNKYIADKYPEYVKAAMKYSNWVNVVKVRDDILKDIVPGAKSYDELKAIYDQKGQLTWEDFHVPEFDSYDGFKSFLYKVRDKYSSKGVIPFAAEKGILSSMNRIFNRFALYAEYRPDLLDVITGPVDKKDDFLKMGKEMNQWYNDGIIDKNFAIDKDEQVNEKLKNGKFAVAMSGSWNIEGDNSALAGKDLKFKYVPVPVAYLTAGDQLYNGYAQIESSRGQKGFVLNKKTLDENKMKKVLNYFNFMATPEGMDLMVWGPKEGGLWEEKDDKRVWKDENFVKVLKGETPVGQGKDFAYYGLLPRDGPSYDWKYLRDYFFYPQGNPRPMTYPYGSLGVTKKAFNINDAFVDSVQPLIKGVFDDHYASWNGTVSTTSVFWSQMSAMNDEINKAIVSKSSDFNSKMDSFFKLAEEKSKLQDYAKEQKKFIDWIKMNKDGMRFLPDTDMSKLK